MLLKRQEQDNKIKAMYASSTICATVFDTTTKDLTVIFNNGGQYKYPSVALTDYTRLEISESTGTDFNTYIKKKYTNFEKMDKVSDATLAAIMKDVNVLKEADDKLQLDSKTKQMYQQMASMLGDYIISGKVNPKAFANLQGVMNDYDKIANPVALQTAVPIIS